MERGLRIAVTGTPGVGKTTVSKLLAEKLKLKHYELSPLIKERRFYSFFDEKRSSYVVDVDKLREFFKSKSNFVADGVVSHYVPADFVVVLRLSPKELEKRLRGRGYSEDKVRENVEAEKLAVIATEVFESYPLSKIIHIDATNKKVEELVNLILKGVGGEEVFEDVDWLEDEISGYKIVDNP